MPRPVVLRPRFGIVLTCLVWAICVFCVVSLAVGPGAIDALRYLPAFGLAAFACWAVFWAPAVSLDLSGVSLHNIVRTRRITWPAITAVETKYTLTIHADRARYTAWAAPAPSRFAASRAAKADLRYLPRSTYGPEGTVALGDVPSSDSGLAALHVRRQWEALREAGYLESGLVEGAGVVTTWHRGTLIALAALALATLIGALA